MHLGLHEYFDHVSSLSDLTLIKRSLHMRHAEETYWKRQNEEVILQEFDGQQGYLSHMDLLLDGERCIPFEIDFADLHLVYVLSDDDAVRLYDRHATLLSRVNNLRATYFYLPPDDYHVKLPPGRTTIFGFYFRASIFRNGNDRRYTFLQPLLDAYRERSLLPKASVDFHVGPVTRRYIETLCKNLQTKQLHNESFIMTKLIQLIELSREKIHEEYEKASANQALLNKATRLIEAYVATHGQAFSIQNLADDLGISVAHLYHIFKREVKMPPKTYKDRLVVQRCYEELLMYGQIGDAAERCGFSSVAAFSQFFKKKTGQTPSAFRSAQSLPKARI